MQDLLPPLEWLAELALVTVTLAGAWVTFERAGERGWAVLVPVYNVIALFRAADLWPWFALGLLVPCLNVFLLGSVSVALARRFGRGTAFGLGLAYLPFVFYPLLALRLRKEAPCPAAPTS